MVRPAKVRLGEVLIQQALITQDQLEKALAEHKRSNRKLGRVFVEMGFVTDKEISVSLAKQLDIPFVDLNKSNVKLELVNKFPESLARRFRCVVLAENNNGFMVGMVDPTDLYAYDEIVRRLHKDVALAVVVESSLLQLIERSYRRTTEISNLAQELEDDISDSNDNIAEFGVAKTAEDAPVVKLLQTLFEDAVSIKASDVHIEPQEKNLHIRFRIDGVMHLQTVADRKIASALVLRLKLTAGLDISEKRLPQDGRFGIHVRKQPVDIRISTMPTQYGESVVMRLLIQNTGGFSLDKLGMPTVMLDRFRKLIHKPSGMVLVTGPTGSGKTTTLYAALNELNTSDNKIITVEDPVEYRLDGINQVQVNDKIDLTFSRVLRSTLRQDPDILLVGEMRDEETAQIGLRAAMTGHLVLSTLHTNDAVTSPVRMIDMGVPKFMVAMSIVGVLAQRLVRLNCQNCIETVELEPYEHAWLAQELGDRVDAHTYHASRGCNVCNGTGYKGRQGVYELLEMNNELVDAANHQDPNEFIRKGRENMQGSTLRSSAIALVVDKQTTVAEAMRISNQLDD